MMLFLLKFRHNNEEKKVNSVNYCQAAGQISGSLFLLLSLTSYFVCKAPFPSYVKTNWNC